VNANLPPLHPDVAQTLKLGEPAARRRWRWIVLAGAVIAAGVIAALYFSGGGEAGRRKLSAAA
jgi:hypothetical protein